MRRSSLALRLTLLAVVTSLAAVVIAGVAISALLRDFVVEQAEEQLDATMVALMASVSFDPVSDRLSLDAAVADPRFEMPLSGWYWQIANAEAALIKSGSLWTAELPLGTDRPDPLAGPQGEALLALRRTFTAPGGTDPLTITASMPRATIDAEIRAIVGPLALSLGLLVVFLAIAIAVQVRIGLRPLARLREGLEQVRRGRANTLPALPHAEIAPIVTQMNDLLATNQATLARTRTHVGTLAHGLKTPLSVIAAEAARLPETVPARAGLLEAAGTIERMIGHHLRRARSAGTVGIAGMRTPVGPVLADLRPVFAGIYAERGLDLSFDTETGAVFAGERQDLEEMLGNLIDNACKWARTRVNIIVDPLSDDPDALLVRIADDGAGMAPEQAARAGERGVRFDESRPGSGLGLAIVNDVAALYGGTLSISATPGGGTTVVLRLPAAPC